MRSFRDIPIRQKLMVITMLTTTAALLLSGIGVVLSDSFLLRSYLQRDLVSLASIIADNSTAALAFEDPRAAAEILTTLRARPHLESACIYRLNGTILATYFRPGTRQGCPAAQPRDDIRFTSRDLTVSQPVVLHDRRIGTLVLLYDLDEVYERMLLYGGTVFAVLIASSLIAFLLSSQLRAVIATPISQLVRATSAVSETRNYSIRAEKFSADELGRLVDGFNEMLAGIQRRDSELRRALVAREEALRQAQTARDSLKTTLESIADAVISTDVEGRVVFANRVAQALVKWPESDFIGKPLDEVFHIVNEFTREKMESPVAKMLREGRITNVSDSTVLIAGDGSEIPIDESGAPVRGENGLIQGTVLVFRDVTVRRRADETSRLLASIVEFSSDAIIGKDLNGLITSWNKGAERIFGYSAEEMIGRPIFTLAPPDRVDEMKSILERIKKGERVESQTVRRTKNGDLINVSLSSSPLFDAFGRITGASKIARDITEQVKAAQRLEQLNADLRMSNERLARSNEDLERFAFVASHDLQEPLRMITAYSQLLVEKYDGPRDAEGAMFVENIVGGTSRMRELLADLLSYAEIGAGPEKPVAIVDLNGVVDNVRRNLQVAIDASGTRIRVDRLPSLRVYEGHFVSLFQNLLENAIKYRSDRAPDIRISFEQTPEHMCFAVADNGIGIASAYHEKIFSPFKRLHGRQIPGTGIGLALCRRVLERYGGRIWVESELGKGTTFIFTLPKHEDFKMEA
jgi:PAS domain S-box-containing protein